MPSCYWSLCLVTGRFLVQSVMAPCLPLKTSIQPGSMRQLSPASLSYAASLQAALESRFRWVACSAWAAALRCSASSMSSWFCLSSTLM